MARIHSDKLTNWYNFQAPFYHLWRRGYDSPLVRRVAALLDGPQPQVVLDAGCGTGLFTIGLGKLYPRHQLQGVDRSAGMLEVGRKQAAKHGLSNVSFLLGDVEALPFADAAFDAVTVAALFVNLNDPGPALREFRRVLKPGGQMIVVEIDRQAMTRFTRSFFKIMIAGYKLVSGVFRRFRFAEKWDLESTTIDEDQFKATLLAEGYDLKAVERVEGHLLFPCVRGR